MQPCTAPVQTPGEPCNSYRDCRACKLKGALRCAGQLRQPVLLVALHGLHKHQTCRAGPAVHCQSLLALQVPRTDRSADHHHQAATLLASPATGP